LLDLNSEKLSKVFDAHRRSDDLDELRMTYQKLTTRALGASDVPRGGELGDATRVRSYALAYRQVLLHRAIALFEGALHALLEQNSYLMVVAIRAFLETAAALGYLHNRLASLAAGSLERSRVDEDIMTLLLGTKDTQIPQGMPPKQIMTMLDYADRSVNKTIMGSKATEHAMLRESYDHLSEFAHPNFHSNSLAFDLDKTAGRFVFHSQMPQRAFAMIGYLVLAASRYVQLHDAIDGLAAPPTPTT